MHALILSRGADSHHRYAPLAFRRGLFVPCAAAIGLLLAFTPAGSLRNADAQSFAPPPDDSGDVVAAEAGSLDQGAFDPRLVVQLLDQVAGVAHSGFHDFLKAEGCWPPRGRDVAFERALCDLAVAARNLRIEARRRVLSTAVLQSQVTRARSIAARIERTADGPLLPHCVDEAIQDSLDLIALLDAWLNPDPHDT